MESAARDERVHPMARTTPRLPEQYYHQEPDAIDFRVNELAADQAGSLSPFGPELDFPLPLHKIRYRHPGPEDRPHLAMGR
jgi:hypothetical protein